MFITGLGIATPPKRYTQTDCWNALQSSPQFEQLRPRSRQILKKVLSGDNGISSRHLAMESLDQAFDLRADTLHRRFKEHAPRLGTEAAEQALSDAQLEASEVDAIIISTCTGYLCPGLTSYVSESLCLRPDILALDLVGQGCGAAIPNMRTAEALITSGRCANVLSVCVEICSAAFYLDDDPGVLVSACLFGDAAGAAVLQAEPLRGRPSIRWKDSASILSPGERELLRFETKNGMLRNILTREIPALASRYAGAVLMAVLKKNHVHRDQIVSWILHAGGRNVLQALQRGLGLEETALYWSAAVLRDLGNVSSPFVYHVLYRTRASHVASGFWWLGSFGAGFSCHGALLEVQTEP